MFEMNDRVLIAFDKIMQGFSEYNKLSDCFIDIMNKLDFVASTKNDSAAKKVLEELTCKDLRQFYELSKKYKSKK